MQTHQEKGRKARARESRTTESQQPTPPPPHNAGGGGNASSVVYHPSRDYAITRVLAAALRQRTTAFRQQEVRSMCGEGKDVIIYLGVKTSFCIL